MKFAAYPEVQAELTEARFTTLTRMVDRANDEKCDLFVVAGDLFDKPRIAKRDILKTAGIVNGFEGHLSVILPGNHDFLSSGETEPWMTFREGAGDTVLLLEKQEVYSLKHYDLDVNLYPAPCRMKHSRENLLGWISQAAGRRDTGTTYHIGIAHGSLEGFSPDFDRQYYPMTPPELLRCDLDLWLMGHTHIQYPAVRGAFDRIFYPATPEPDGFDCHHEGQAWIIEMAEDKKIFPESISTGRYRFIHDQLEIRSVSDLKALSARYPPESRSHLLCKLKLEGRLPAEEHHHLHEARKALEKDLFYLQWDQEGVTEEITSAAINREYTQGSFPHMLLTSLAQDADNPESLQIAYRLLGEARR